MALFEKILDVESNIAKLRQRRYGAIEVIDGQLQAVHLKPWPKVISAAEINLFGRRTHHKVPQDRCVLYYNQPWFHSNFLALKYILSNFGASYASFLRTTQILDQVAFIKKSAAIVCEASNIRLSGRLMNRLGWERHLPGSQRRHFIRRFYGEYPEHAKIASLHFSIPKNDSETADINSEFAETVAAPIEQPTSEEIQIGACN